MDNQAQQIAAKFDNDGQNYWIDEGEKGVDIIQASIDDICVRFGADVDQCWERETTRYTFADGSVIVTQAGAWDLGYRDCFCARECGHDDDRCEATNA